MKLEDLENREGLHMPSPLPADPWIRMKLLIFLFLAFLALHCSAIGVNYGTLGNNLPSPSRVVQLIKSSPAGIDRVKIFSYSPQIISAFANSGLKLAIDIPNDQILSFAQGNRASEWVRNTVVPSASTINLVIVGNEVDHIGGDLWRNLVPAMQRVRDALTQHGLSGSIKVTSPVTTGVLQQSFPPSAGLFDYNKVGWLLEFLSDSGSPFMVNVYPYFSWLYNKGQISLDYALFRSGRVVVQDGNLGYTNLLDAMLDALVAGLEKANRAHLELMIGETGWPNGGGDGASVENARQYNTELLKKVRSGRGTPRRPRWINVYIFALFNENQKPGGVEQHWGLLYPDGKPVYWLPSQNGLLACQGSQNSSLADASLLASA